ncbi:MAG: ribonuclease H-like YkuK family protein [Thermincola sp.]|jgi:predicted RNase H-related nuclease YkuK (DUF458 family)|nr:ribonuclease H-like YkuK family protein [Thermincola sp.]MDT3701546.1 ribonuclease H-like YkuK family protein [Thermincola sp.]
MIYFTSPTKGKITMEEMCTDILGFVNAHPGDKYRLIIGTDSQPGQVTCFVTAVIIHREGKGARFYYCRSFLQTPLTLKHRIFEEASRSLEMAGDLIICLADGNPGLTIEIHVDIGEKGRSREMIQQVVSMINTSGYLVRIKPDSYGASKVADRFTKN